MSLANSERDYLDVVYNKVDKPFTQYPFRLTQYLFLKYKLLNRKKILDLGCGRGEFLKGFIKCGLVGYGVDRSTIAKSFCPEAEILQSNLGEEPLPYQDNNFDVVFSKSVLEHFYYPEKIIKEIHRIVKPHGLVITMIPDWESVYRTFYEDYTHRTPFTVTSLRNIFIINGFDNVKAEKFRQLPFLWKMPWLEPFSQIVALTMPKSLSQYSKLVKFSKEVMLLASCVKRI